MNIYDIIVICAGFVFAVCTIAVNLKSNEACKPEPKPAERCVICNHEGKLCKGKCANCWRAYAACLEMCDTCGRMWEPAPEDSRDICPRCRIVGTPIGIPVESLTESERMDLAQRNQPDQREVVLVGDAAMLSRTELMKESGNGAWQSAGDVHD